VDESLRFLAGASSRKTAAHTPSDSRSCASTSLCSVLGSWRPYKGTAPSAASSTSTYSTRAHHPLRRDGASQSCPTAWRSARSTTRRTTGTSSASGPSTRGDSRDILLEVDGPMLLHGLQELHGAPLTLPPRPANQSDRESYLLPGYVGFTRKRLIRHAAASCPSLWQRLTCLPDCVRRTRPRESRSACVACVTSGVAPNVSCPRCGLGDVEQGVVDVLRLRRH